MCLWLCLSLYTALIFFHVIKLFPLAFIIAKVNKFLSRVLLFSICVIRDVCAFETILVVATEPNRFIFDAVVYLAKLRWTLLFITLHRFGIQA